eukprot:scaffold1529_cov86-Cylindrotheca_fusiformis.AAC.5
MEFAVQSQLTTNTLPQQGQGESTSHLAGSLECSMVGTSSVPCGQPVPWGSHHPKKSSFVIRFSLSDWLRISRDRQYHDLRAI